MLAAVLVLLVIGLLFGLSFVVKALRCGSVGMPTKRIIMLTCSGRRCSSPRSSPVVCVV